MGFGRYRFRRSFGNVSSQFRGARPDTYPLFSGLLDQYGGASAAYSLRALSSGWLAGDVVEVRRSSGGDPESFTASQITSGAMLAWVTEFSGTADGFVSTWYDQSGNANNATQATTTSQPKIVSAGALVTGGLDFDGVDDSLGLTGLSLTSTGWSSFVKWNADSFATDMAILRCRPLGVAAGINGIIPLETTSTSKFSPNILEDNSVEAIAINTSAFGTLSTATDYLNTTILTSSAVDLWTNSSQETYTNSILSGAIIPISTVGITQIYIGTADGSTRPFNGKICEVILYDSDQTANRAAIEALI